MASSPITSWKTGVEKIETMTDFIFLGSKITIDGAAIKLKDACFLEESYDKPRAEISLCQQSSIWSKL